MAGGTYLPNANIQYFDNDGLPLAAGTLTFYAAGTTTKLDTYNDPDLALIHVNPNPITLDSSGKSPYPVFLQVASYKQDVKDSGGVSMDGWPKDNIAAVSLTTSSIGVAVFQFGGDASSPCPTTQTTYPTGTTYDKCHAGSTWWILDSADLVGTYVLQSMMMVGAAGTVTLALVNLTDGSPDTPIVSVSSSSLTGEQQESAAITFASGGAAKKYAIKIKNTGGVLGFAWGVQIVRTT